MGCKIATGKAVFGKLLKSQNLDLNCLPYVIPTILYKEAPSLKWVKKGIGGIRCDEQYPIEF
jgi:hypothetical protein